MNDADGLRLLSAFMRHQAARREIVGFVILAIGLFAACGALSRHAIYVSPTEAAGFITSC